jgi:hypothetical protein
MPPLTKNPTPAGQPSGLSAIAGSVSVGDTLICMIDEWGRGEKQAFDGHVTWKNGRGVDVCYLSGYRSRNDFVEWKDVVAKLDMRCKRVSVADGAFEGHFRVFSQNNRDVPTSGTNGETL